MKRIICIGNRHCPEDSVGPHVYDLIRREPLPADIEVIEGGLAGLDLLRCVEGSERVVFVDQVAGFGRPGEVVVLDPQEAAAIAAPAYDHAAGLPYLLRMLPAVCGGPVPEIAIIGIEKVAEGSALAEAAALALELASAGCAAGGVR